MRASARVCVASDIYSYVNAPSGQDLQRIKHLCDTRYAGAVAVSVRAASWARWLARCCNVDSLLMSIVALAQLFCFVVRLSRTLSIMVASNSELFASLDGSAESTIESVMNEFLDTVEYPGKDDELKKLTLAVLKENMLTASCFY